MDKKKMTVKLMINKISGLVALLILGLLPLIYNDFYFDILPTKYRFYYITFILFIIITMILLVISNYKVKMDIIGKMRSMTLAELAIIIFMVIAVFSTLFSDYKYESFWGNEGRFSGCFLMLLYGIGFLLISRLLCYRNIYINVFLITGIAVCLFGITDYFQLNIFGFKDHMNPGQTNMFTSTIGNINTYTAYAAMVVAVSSILFLSERRFGRLVLYYFATLVSLAAIIMGLSDNAYIALGALFAFAPLYCFKSKTGMRRYTLLLVTFSLVIYTIDWINKLIPESVLQMEGILNKLSGYSHLEVLVLLLMILCASLYIKDYVLKKSSRNDDLPIYVRYVWGLIILSLFIGLVYVIVDANILGNSDKYGSLSNYIVFNDDWGTHRGHNWRIGIENYKQFTPIHKIFGYGPDTYGIITHNNNLREMVNKYSEVYDSAHNEYLQYFITMGPIGLASYIVWIVAIIANIFQKGKENPYLVAIAFAVICYCAQATVNIALPIVTPIMIMLLSVGAAGYRELKSPIE